MLCNINHMFKFQKFKIIKNNHAKHELHVQLINLLVGTL